MCATRDRVVERRAGEIRVAAPVERRVEVEQLGRDLPDAAGAAEPLGVARR